MKLYPGILLLTLCCGCTSYFAALRSGKDYDIALEDLRSEVADVKHTLHATEVEFRLLEEKLDVQGTSKVSELKEQIATLIRKISTLEHSQDKIAADIRSLSAHANQTTASLSQYRDKIQEIDRHVKEAPKAPPRRINYKVKSGDTLERIARKHHLAVEELKRANSLESDRIVVGQDLMIPSHE
jgi:LysM repeat protein